jgi:hypothetical protein
VEQSSQNFGPFLPFSKTLPSGKQQGDQMCFEKISQNIAQPVFCQNYYKTCKVLICSHKIWATSLIYK